MGEKNADGDENHRSNVSIEEAILGSSFIASMSVCLILLNVALS